MLSVLLYAGEVVVASVAVAATAAALYIYRLKTKYSHLPGPKETSFWFGSLAEVTDMRIKDNFFLAHILYEWRKKYGDTFVMRMAHRVFVFTSDPVAVKQLLITGGHPKDYKAYTEVSFIYGVRSFGRGLVTEVDDSIWAKQRAVLNPAFHRKFLRSIMESFNQTADDLMDKLAEQADGKTVVQLDHELQLATLDIIGKVAFGKELGALRGSQSTLPSAITKMMEGFSASVKDVFAKVKFWDKRAFKKEVRDSLNLLRSIATGWLRERKEMIRRGEAVPEDILTLIIQNQETGAGCFDMEVALDNIVTIFLAGQETTANALSFMMMEIGRRPDIKKKLCREIDEVFGQKPQMEFDDIAQLEYSSMVVKETLRLYPPASMTFRELKEDTVIQGYNVPKGTTVIISPYVTGRSAEFHPDALQFNPERFQPDAEGRPSMYTYFPFALGPRNCIGQNFAQIEAKVILAKFLQRFDLELDPSQEFKIQEATTLKPKGGVKCTLTLRKDFM